MELQRVIDEFLVYNKVEKCVRPLTVAAYASDLRCLKQHWEKVGLPDTIEIATIRSVRQCLVSMHAERPYKTATMNRRIDTWRSFFRFAVEQGYVANDPTDKIKSPKAEKKLPIYLRETEVRLLLSMPERRKWQTWRRDKAILYVLALTGMRRSELLCLTSEDVRFDSMAIRVMGKGQQERLCPMNEELSDVLWEYLQSQLPVSPDGPLFRARTGRPMHRTSLHDLFKRYVKAAGLDSTRISLHTIRHTFATLLLNRGTDLRTIQELLGHVEISSTQIYTHTDSAKKKCAVDGLHLEWGAPPTTTANALFVIGRCLMLLRYAYPDWSEWVAHASVLAGEWALASGDDTCRDRSEALFTDYVRLLRLGSNCHNSTADH